MRTYILLFLFFLALKGIAQDRLVMTDGQEMAVWITEIGENYIKYIHAEKEESSEYNLPKRMVNKIIYATGDELVFSPMSKNPPPSAAPNPQAASAPTELKIESLTPVAATKSRTDLIKLMNGGSIEAMVTEINDRDVEYNVGGNVYKIPITEVSSITYVDGNIEEFQDKIEISAEAARKTAQEFRKKRIEVQDERIKTSPKNPVATTAKNPKSPPSFGKGTLKLRLITGINLITGLGAGARDLDWVLQVEQANLPTHDQGQYTAEWDPTAGIHVGLMGGYAVQPRIQLIGGLTVSQKGYITVRTLSYRESESGNDWIRTTREREQMVHVDIPVGIEVVLISKLSIQTGLVGSVVVNGNTFLRTDADAFSTSGTRLEDISSNENERKVYEGVGATYGGFVGARVILTNRLGIHLRAVSNVGGGYTGAFANTVIQLGAGYRL